MSQKTFYDDWNATNATPAQTSREATEQVAPHLNALQSKLLAYLTSCPDGATDEQMQLCAPMNPSTQRPRRGELVAMGLVRNSGRTRRTKSGSKAIVWEVVR